MVSEQVAYTGCAGIYVCYGQHLHGINNNIRFVMLPFWNYFTFFDFKHLKVCSMSHTWLVAMSD